MKHIIQTQAIQVQTNSKDIERLESLMENQRSSGANKEDELDLAKRLIMLERECNQVSKEQKHGINTL